MSNEITWTLEIENVEKIVASLEEAGRKVDMFLVNIIFERNYKNQPIATEYLSTVCDMFRAEIWNVGAVN
jgi:hypothetical protein